jgi:hypothetical protein
MFSLTSELSPEEGRCSSNGPFSFFEKGTRPRHSLAPTAEPMSKDRSRCRLIGGGLEMGDKCWKWRIFYVNRDDPKIFVPKRYGIGYTLNFGNRWSWGVVALILVGIALPLSIPGIMIRVIKHRAAG